MISDNDKALHQLFQEFFAAVGYAISRWADVDRELFHLCRFAINTDDTKTSIIFYRIPTIGEHVTLVDSLMCSALSDKHLTVWKDLQKRATALLPFRNNIAHNPAGRSVRVVIPPHPSWDAPNPRGKTEHWWSIRMEDVKLLSGKNKKQFEVKRDDVVEHANLVEDLYLDLNSFRARLPKRPLARPLVSAAPKTPHSSGRGGKKARIPPKQKRPPQS